MKFGKIISDKIKSIKERKYKGILYGLKFGEIRLPCALLYCCKLCEVSPFALSIFVRYKL